MGLSDEAEYPPNLDKKPKLIVSVLWIIWPLKGEKMFVSGVER